MKIAQVAPLTDSVPPKLSLATHRLIHHLTEIMVEQGHEVTLFATRDSRTLAQLEPIWPEGLLYSPIHLVQAPLTLLLERAFFSGQRFDVIHSHLDTLAFPCARRCLSPVVTTVHGQPDLPGSAQAYREFRELPLVAMLKGQQRSLQWANWVATVHPGLPATSYTFHPVSEGYLAFWDQIAVDTAPIRAIHLAQEVGLPLKLAGDVDRYHDDYFENGIRPFLNEASIDYVGHITGSEIDDLLGNALAVILPGRSTSGHLSVIEALAAGTPVLVHSSNVHSELIQNGVTGFVCETDRDMIRAIRTVSALDRRHCRQAFEAQFTAERMVAKYLEVYEKIIATSWTAPSWH
jgi:glycosyltransferase involved in cell wall biosynthesis